ncbi:hypothetical protein C8R44DRAFT_711043 [Mycena epipterygia]|nr:hypothetical protein C8R44DRAFT_711043 [Mycena epipterygia]
MDLARTGDAAVGKPSVLVRLTDQCFLADPDLTLDVTFRSNLLHYALLLLECCWCVSCSVCILHLCLHMMRWAVSSSMTSPRAASSHLARRPGRIRSCILVGNKRDLARPTSPNALCAPQKPLYLQPKSACSPSVRSEDDMEAAFVAAAEAVLGKVKGGVFGDARLICSIVISLRPHFRLSTSNLLPHLIFPTPCLSSALLTLLSFLLPPLLLYFMSARTPASHSLKFELGDVLCCGIVMRPMWTRAGYRFLGWSMA